MHALPRRRLIALAVALPLLSPAVRAHAADAPDAGRFIQGVVANGLKIITNQSLAAPDRERSFGQLFTRSFDISRISRFVLGRYWRTASEDERRQFTDTYTRFIVHNFAEQLSKYNGEILNVTGARAEGNAIVVATDLVRPTGEAPSKVSWRVTREPDGFKIVDVDVEGVSLLITQRQEFASLIQRNGGSVSGLTQAIRRKMGG